MTPSIKHGEPYQLLSSKVVPNAITITTIEKMLATGKRLPMGIRG